MRISWIFWWIVNIFWLLIFTVLSLIIWLRKVDGSGAIQTSELRLISFFILLVAFIFPAVIQIIWLIINMFISKVKHKNNTYAELQQ